tara:strand:- start:70 stop:960 length:891 start_codon:yes stop_codon:yes gene_type:complete
MATTIENPYLQQVKEIDKELKRLEGILEKALKGSDDKKTDLKILNAKLRKTGQLKRNKLGIDRRFWSRRGIGEQITALKNRRTKLTNFLGKRNIGVGSDVVPTMPGFRPKFIEDIDSVGRTNKINPYYIAFFNEAKKKKDRAAYDTVRSDLTSGGGNIPGMSEIELDKKIQEQLPEGNMFRSDSQFYIGNVNEYGEKKVVRKSDDQTTGEAIAVNNAAKRNNNNRNQLRSGIYDVRGGGGFYGRDANILTAEGRSTALSINTSDRTWGKAKPGEMLGVMPRKLREKYDREVLKIGS